MMPQETKDDQNLDNQDGETKMSKSDSTEVMCFRKQFIVLFFYSTTIYVVHQMLEQGRALC